MKSSEVNLRSLSNVALLVVSKRICGNALRERFPARSSRISGPGDIKQQPTRILKDSQHQQYRCYGYRLIYFHRLPPRQISLFTKTFVQASERARLFIYS